MTQSIILLEHRMMRIFKNKGSLTMLQMGVNKWQNIKTK